MYHISLYFDEKGTDKINKLIKSVEKKTGCTYMSDRNISPHLTLAVSAGEGVKAGVSDIVRLIGLRVNEFSKFKLRICSIGCFKPHVLYLQPVLSAELEELVKFANGIFDRVYGTGEKNAYMQYSRIEHISIAKRLGEPQMQAAFGALYANFEPFETEAAGIKLENTNPRAVIKKWEFIS